MIGQQTQNVLQAAMHLCNGQAGLIRWLQAFALVAPTQKRHCPIVVVLHQVIGLAVLKQLLRGCGLHQFFQATLHLLDHRLDQEVSQRNLLLCRLVPSAAGLQQQREDTPRAWCQMQQELTLLEEAIERVLVSQHQPTQCPQDLCWHRCGGCGS